MWSSVRNEGNKMARIIRAML
ncbi:hypothetical protein RRM65_001717 [Aeromonas salmonicida subsp. salmonicida]|nr:hypothetical protein [Aeromonas salmonicida subsp. salmonicida]